jgi:uncharacterized membrane protein YdjX (TVP38/TMEM64 family)
MSKSEPVAAEGAEATVTEGSPFTRKPSLTGVLTNLLFLVVTLGVVYYVAVHLGIADLRSKVEQAGVFAPILVIILKATTIVVVPLGGNPIYPISGALFGFWEGWGLTILGDALGASIAFYLSRFFGQNILRYVMGRSQMPVVLKLLEQLSDTKTFIKTRLFFAGFPELFAYASGLTRVSFALFLPVYMSVMLLSSGLLVAFGDLILTQNIYVIAGIGIVSSILAVFGVYWFHENLTQGS